MAQAAAAAGDALKRKGRASLYRIVGIIVGLVVLLVAVNVATHGDFLAPGNVLNILRQIAVNAILATGQTFVIITAGIDLSVGSLVALTGVLMAGTLAGIHTPWLAVLVAIVVGIAVGGGAGAINGTPVVKFGLPPFITTLAMMLMARGVAFMFTNGAPIEIDNAGFNDLGSGLLLPTLGRLVHIPGIPVPIVIMVAVVVAASFVLGQTRFGRYVYAIGGNREAARRAGISVNRIRVLAYMLAGFTATAALIIVDSRGGGATTSIDGGQTVLYGVAAAVIGGTSLLGGRGKMVHALLGGLVIATIYNGMGLISLSADIQYMVTALVLIAAATVDALSRRGQNA
ncbi:MAG TPA: ABC transporter permease [Candidatus Eremiobacteraceae bacterium]